MGESDTLFSKIYCRAAVTSIADLANLLVAWWSLCIFFRSRKVQSHKLTDSIVRKPKQWCIWSDQAATKSKEKKWLPCVGMHKHTQRLSLRSQTYGKEFQLLACSFANCWKGEKSEETWRDSPLKQKAEGERRRSPPGGPHNKQRKSLTLYS